MRWMLVVMELSWTAFALTKQNSLYTMELRELLPDGAHIRAHVHQDRNDSLQPHETGLLTTIFRRKLVLPVAGDEQWVEQTVSLGDGKLFSGICPIHSCMAPRFGSGHGVQTVCDDYDMSHSVQQSTRALEVFIEGDHGAQIQCSG